MNREEWTSVLKLSTMWRFGELRKKAIGELTKLAIDSVDKVILARDYKVEKWLVDGYTELVRRDPGLSSKEWKRLSYETALQLYEKREDTFRRGLGQPHYDYDSGCYFCGSRIFGNLEADMRSLFQEELADVKYHGMQIE